MGSDVAFARTPDELTAELTRGAPGLVMVDLTTGWDHASFLDRLDAAAAPPLVLGITTHALARQTQPFHARCARVVTRETLTAELPRLLADGIEDGGRRIAS